MPNKKKLLAAADEIVRLTEMSANHKTVVDRLKDMIDAAYEE